MKKKKKMVIDLLSISHFYPYSLAMVKSLIYIGCVYSSFVTVTVTVSNYDYMALEQKNNENFVDMPCNH